MLRFTATEFQNGIEEGFVPDVSHEYRLLMMEVAKKFPMGQLYVDTIEQERSDEMNAKYGHLHQLQLVVLDTDDQILYETGYSEFLDAEPGADHSFIDIFRPQVA